MKHTVTTPLGRVEGFSENGLIKFLGLPFAKAPLGELRFRRPQPIEPWDGVYEAADFRKNPMQVNLLYGPSCFSEDCLYLNIFVPEHAEGTRLPVMLWIPGGAYASGGSGRTVPNGPAEYDCSNIARDSKCLLVSMSYRLGVFGFLNLHRYSDRFDDHVGMWDIIEAMKWINRNISAFGGDPDNVTIFGESAGGGAVSALLFCDAAKPYFHKAIIESNCWESFYDVEMEDLLVRKYLEYASLTPETVEDLLKLSYEEIFAAQKKLDSLIYKEYFLRCTFAPVIDGEFISDFPTLGSVKGLDKPVLVGSTHDEGQFLVAAYMTKPEDTGKLADVLMKDVPKPVSDYLLSHYEFPSLHSLGQLLTDVMYTFPLIRFAEHMTREADAPVFVYQYCYVTPFQQKTKLLACHVSDLIALFPMQNPPYSDWRVGDNDNLETIGKRMRQYWGGFARTGVPQAEGLIEWKPYDEKSRLAMIFNAEDKLVSDHEPEVRRIYEGVDRIEI